MGDTGNIIGTPHGPWQEKGLKTFTPTPKGKVTIDMGFERVNLDSSKHEVLMECLDTLRKTFGAIHIKNIVWI